MPIYPKGHQLGTILCIASILLILANPLAAQQLEVLPAGQFETCNEAFRASDKYRDSWAGKNADSRSAHYIRDAIVGTLCTRDEIVTFFESRGYNLDKERTEKSKKKYAEFGITPILFCKPHSKFWRRFFFHTDCEGVVNTSLRYGRVRGISMYAPK